MMYLELVLALLSVLVLPYLLLVVQSPRAQALLFAVEVPILVWLTWQVATYQ